MKCFSLFQGLIHILSDTEKPLSAVVASLMSAYVCDLSGKGTCQIVRDAFHLKAGGSAKDSIRPSNSPSLAGPRARCLAARGNN